MSFPRKIIWNKVFILSGLLVLLLAVINSIFFVSLRIFDTLKVAYFIKILNITYVLYGIGFITLFIGLIIWFILNFKIIIKTKKKYIILIIGLITILIILHNATKCDSYYGPPKIQDECTNLSQSECFEHPLCREFYGPSYCSCNVCTADIGYKWCVKMPEKEIIQAEIDKTLCEKTNGAWSIDHHNKPGDCGCSIDPLEDGSDPRLIYGIGRIYFDAEKGCISDKRVCEENGGYWKNPEPWLFEDREDIAKDKCVTSSPFAVLNWSKEKNLCVITRYENPYPGCVYS